jgi:hypothetical protein
MGARIIDLAAVRAHRAGQAKMPAGIEGATDFTECFHFWCGASGRRYIHTIYSFRECPALPQANYILVRRDEDGRRVALAVGRLTHDAASLNLAEIRHRGASLGANEVHVHLLAGSSKQSQLVELDLRSGQLGGASLERTASNWH